MTTTALLIIVVLYLYSFCSLMFLNAISWISLYRE